MHIALWHGFDISLLEGLDTYQIHQLNAHTSPLFEKTVYPSSYPEHYLIMDLYQDKGKNVAIDNKLIKLVYSAMNPKADNLLTKHRFFNVDKVIPRKHHRKKTKQKGDGNTPAFLGSSVPSLIRGYVS